MIPGHHIENPKMRWLSPHRSAPVPLGAPGANRNSQRLRAGGFRFINLKHGEFMAGWWLTYPSEKYEFVSWDDDISNIWKNIFKKKQTTNQMVMLYPD